MAFALAPVLDVGYLDVFSYFMLSYLTLCPWEKEQFKGIKTDCPVLISVENCDHSFGPLEVHHVPIAAQLQ